VYFQALQERLLEIARERIRAGVFTERKLARVSGLSQPHMHNLLKRVRSPSMTSADQLMEALGLKVQDLLWRATTDRDFGVRAVPLLRNRVGPGTNASFELTRGHVPLPETLLRSLVDPVAAHLGPDLVLPKLLNYNDLVLLDQNPKLRSSPSPHSIWVVSDGTGLKVRYVRIENRRLHLVNEVNRDEPGEWHSISLENEGILDIVRARIAWMSREMDDGL
jgi:hypothetical protein